MHQVGQEFIHKEHTWNTNVTNNMDKQTTTHTTKHNKEHRDYLRRRFTVVDCAVGAGRFAADFVLRALRVRRPVCCRNFLPRGNWSSSVENLFVRSTVQKVCLA